MSDVTKTFVLTLGWFGRRRVIDAVTSLAWERGLSCTNERAGRDARFTITGPSRQVEIFLFGIELHFGERRCRES